ncbi:ABC transporter substrate-binding protein [Streptosporangium sp. NPDC050855]|uniref:ABC transporter substrate-binding protein n=1 Tax=Streptosporangium sp. NPDC050855 TaxID=3366194 RepID=UPI0037897F6A
MNTSRNPAHRRTRRSLALVSVVCLSLALTACGRDQGTTTASGGGAGGQKLTIAVVPGSTGYFYWGSLHAGAKAAADELGAELVWRGTATQSDITGQTNILQDFVNRKVSGIAFAANDTKALAPIVEQAAAAKIPIVSADAGIDPQSIPLIATDNENAAGQAADFIGEKLGGKGKVALLPFLATSATSQAREKGFTDRLTEKYPDIEIVAKKYTDGDVNKSLTIMNDVLSAHPDLNAVFGLNEPSVIGAIRALEAKKTKGVTVVGFDNAPDEVKALKAGTVAALVVQDPYKIGYESVMALKKMVDGGTVENVDTGATLVTPDNIDDPKIEKLINPPVEK